MSNHPPPPPPPEDDLDPDPFSEFDFDNLPKPPPSSLGEEGAGIGWSLLWLGNALLLDALNCLLFGIIAAQMWSWFVLPAFPAAPELHWVTAAGLRLLLQVVRATNASGLDLEAIRRVKRKSFSRAAKDIYEAPKMRLQRMLLAWSLGALLHYAYPEVASIVIFGAPL